MGSLIEVGGDPLDDVEAGGTDHDPDHAVLLEDIVHQIVVVADLGSRAHDQLGPGPTLGGRRLVGRLGEDLVVAPGRIADAALEDADRVGNLGRCAIVLRHHGRKEGGVGGAVHALAQRAQEDAETVLAAVHV